MFLSGKSSKAAFCILPSSALCSGGLCCELFASLQREGFHLASHPVQKWWLHWSKGGWLDPRQC